VSNVSPVKKVRGSRDLPTVPTGPAAAAGRTVLREVTRWNKQSVKDGASGL